MNAAVAFPLPYAPAHEDKWDMRVVWCPSTVSSTCSTLPTAKKLWIYYILYLPTSFRVITIRYSFTNQLWYRRAIYFGLVNCKSNSVNLIKLSNNQGLDCLYI